MHFVFGGIFGLDGKEGARAYMQRDRFARDSAPIKLRHEFWREV
jgi:hypothetical protein